MRSLLLVVAATVSIVGQSASGKELIGAKGALRTIREATQQRDNDSTPKQPDESKFGIALKQYRTDRQNLGAKLAAERWIELYDLWRNSGESDGGSRYSHRQESRWSQLLLSLPGPESWPSLAEIVLAREISAEKRAAIKDHNLRLLVARLTKDDETLKTELDALKILADPKPAGSPDANSNSSGILGRIISQFTGRDNYRNSSHFDEISSAIVNMKDMANLDDPIARFSDELKETASDRETSIEVPDLVGRVGAEKATELLLRAFAIRNLYLRFDTASQETVELARKLASAHVDSLVVPLWQLCHTTDASVLFESLLTRFGVDSPTSSDDSLTEDNYQIRDAYLNATSFYFQGLILRGEDEAATKLLVEQPRASEDDETDNFGAKADGGLFTAWHQRDFTPREQQRIYRFLAEVAEKHADLNVWDFLVIAATNAGQIKEFSQLLDRVLARNDLDAKLRRNLKDLHARSLMFSGDIEGAMAQYRERLTEIGDPTTGPDTDETKIQDYVAIAQRFITVGKLQNRADWVDDGIAMAEKILAMPSRVSDNNRQYAISHGIAFLFAVYEQEMIRRKQWGRLEEVCIQKIGAVGSLDEYTGRDQAVRYGLTLANVYFNAERYGDVVTLIDEATWWGQDDLGEQIGTWRYDGSTLQLVAAQTFAKTGRRDLARTLAERLVAVRNNSDVVWELLLDLAGDDFPEVAQKMFLRDQFEERPLIWLARYQLHAGHIPDAEATVRRAIGIDPSDGEQGKGDRMRAYQVLADVLEAKGDSQANFFRGVVRAIRMAEDADDLFKAGMVANGISLYKASLDQFADAYCIQSRLAIQLVEHGDYEGAAKHYQRAYELMPDSFGRVESHCFGCEGVFKGELARNVAEEVFRRLLVERPHDARVHYLMGYMKESQGDPVEAVTLLQKATRLDPDYVNAWKKIIELRSEVLIPDSLIDDAVINLYRLTPLANAQIDRATAVRDLERLWNAAIEVERRIPKLEVTGPIYRLKGAAAAIASAPRTGFYESGQYDGNRGVNPMPPNDVLAGDSFIRQISSVMDFAGG